MSSFFRITKNKHPFQIKHSEPHSIPFFQRISIFTGSGLSSVHAFRNNNFLVCRMINNTNHIKLTLVKKPTIKDMTEQLLAKLKIMLNFLVLERAAQNKKGKKFNCLRITACFTCKQIFHQLLKDSSLTTKFLQSIINYQLPPAQKHRRKPALLQPHNKLFSLILFSSLS